MNLNIIQKLPIFLIFIFSGCSYFTNKVELLAIKDANSKIQFKESALSTKKIFCPQNNKFQIILEDEATSKNYEQILKKFFAQKKFNFVQKAAFFSLIEMNRRPDRASPTSRLQFYIKSKNQNAYYDIRPKDLENLDSMPYLKGIEIMLRKHGNGLTLKKTADIIDKGFQTPLAVSNEFEKFLRLNQKDISRNEILSDYFMKGDEILTKHESFRYIKINKLIDQYNNNGFSNDLNYEFDKNSMHFTLKPISKNTEVITCNSDTTNDLSKNDLFYNNNRASHFFAMKDGEDLFLAVATSIQQKPLKTIEGTYFFLNRPSPFPIPICEYKSSNNDFIFFSTKGKSPIQHLKHLIDYDIINVDSFSSLTEVLNFPRHLFLSNPERILYESNKGRKSQIDFFMSMNFPIYHTENLGNIFGYASFNSKKSQISSLIIDSRENSFLRCAE